MTEVPLYEYDHDHENKFSERGPLIYTYIWDGGTPVHVVRVDRNDEHGVVEHRDSPVPPLHRVVVVPEGKGVLGGKAEGTGRGDQVQGGLRTLWPAYPRRPASFSCPGRAACQ
jgi:hypothetical protein